MVHALEEIHRLLKPGGELVDIHPISEHSSIEIHRNGNIDTAGHLEVRQWCIDFQQADSALNEVARRGLFSVEQKGIFNTLTYYDSAAEMSTAFKEEIDKYARDPEGSEQDVSHAEALAARTAEMFREAASGAELIRRERSHISRLKSI